MGDTDLDLIRQFVREKSQPAFTELVRRHVDLVYSAALRQVRSPDLAGEVSQSVFLDLAREADRLKPDSILTAWLYQVTRRRAIDVIRRESRRHARERLAAEMAAMNTTANAADWPQIEPLLDEAMDALDETDRAAILLRFFENKSLRDVGAALGASDDAAQKRVSRAVERLREFFAKRGVTVGAGGLAVLITANAVQAAPAGLVLTVSAVAALTGATLSATATSTVVAHAANTTMNFFNLKSLAALVATALVAGTGTYYAQQGEARRLRNDNQTLTERTTKLASERDESLAAGAARDAELARLKADQDDLLRLRAEVSALRAQTNELAKLRDSNRALQAALQKAIQPAQSTGPDADNDPQRQLVLARANDAKRLALGIIMYAQNHANLIPDRFGQFEPDFTNGLPDSATNRFDLVFSGSITNVPPHSVEELILLRGTEELPQAGKRVRIYGFLDGHVLMKTEPPEGFDAWEKQHILPAPAR